MLEAEGVVKEFPLIQGVKQEAKLPSSSLSLEVCPCCGCDYTVEELWQLSQAREQTQFTCKHCRADLKLCCLYEFELTPMWAEEEEREGTYG